MRRIRRYRYHSKPIGKGTYGLAYRGYNIRTRKPVVIKVSKHIRKARKEAAMLKRAHRHRFIARLVEFFVYRKRAYIVMERAVGKPLAKRKRWVWLGKRRPLKHAAIMTIRTLQTISYLQKKGVYHHDIGPTNIIARHRNPLKIKLVDFGSAKIHRTRPRYNSDLARSAFLMYFLLKGRVRVDTLIRKKQFPPIRVRPLRLQRILRKAMHPDKRRRYRKPATLIKLIKPYTK